MKTISSRQKELITLCGYRIIDNRLIGDKESISSIYYDAKSGLFSIDIKAYNFKPGNYEEIEMFTITVNHMLGLIYELNIIGGYNEKEKMPVM